MLYDDFKPIVDLVLNNWTALQLAVEHGMGAPGGEKVNIFENKNMKCNVTLYITQNVRTQLKIIYAYY